MKVCLSSSVAEGPPTPSGGYGRWREATPLHGLCGRFWASDAFIFASDGNPFNLNNFNPLQVWICLVFQDSFDTLKHLNEQKMTAMASGATPCTFLGQPPIIQF